MHGHEGRAKTAGLGDAGDELASGYRHGMETISRWLEGITATPEVVRGFFELKN
jgi:hypothetical protein